MRVLICMESSGVIREAFRSRGHDAWSCDLLPADDWSPFHYQGDVRTVLRDHPNWDLLGFHPPCTFVAGSGLHWNDRGRGWEDTDRAVGFALWCMAQEIPHYVENPVGLLSSLIRKPDQIIQPYEFGEDASKATCLWLHRLAPLRPTTRVQGRKVEWPIGSGVIVERWANQTDSGQNKLPPSETRWKERSRSFPGIAAAMADQWEHQTETPLELGFTEWDETP